MFQKNKHTTQSHDFKTKEGFEKLYEQNARKLFMICYARVQNREEAEEIVHDIFKSVWERRLVIIDQEGSIEKYLVRAVKLKTIDFFRKQSRHARNEACDLEHICASNQCTENLYHFNELQERLTQLVDQLPCTCRKVFQLSREKGLSNKEIASTLLISEKTVESHMTKALSHLRKNLAEYSLMLTFLLCWS